jgi:hypothetical protein
VHAQDLLALHPSDRDLEAAAAWVREQDPTPAFANILVEVMDYVRQQLG